MTAEERELCRAQELKERDQLQQALAWARILTDDPEEQRIVAILIWAGLD